jgi:hypothetical protein
MKLTKENVCVFIDNEAQLEEARKMLDEYGEKVDTSTFDLSAFNHVQFDTYEQDWFVCDEDGLKIITLKQLEEILKQSK